MAVVEGGDGVGGAGVPASLVVDSNGERASDTGLMLAPVLALDMMLRGTVAITMLDEIPVDTSRITIATESRISDIIDLESGGPGSCDRATPIIFVHRRQSKCARLNKSET